MKGRLLLAAAATLLAPTGAEASTTFTGVMSGLGVAGPSATCAPLPFGGSIDPATTTGTSNIGNFTYGHTICLAGAAGGPIVGTFTLSFAEGNLLGSLSGSSAPTGTPGLSAINLDYLVTGGTGLFAGATGAFTGIGTTNSAVRPSIVNYAFEGQLSIAPEPGTWAMMLLGFGAIGFGLRRQRRSVLQAAG